MTTVTRPALLSAMAYMLQAIGATPAELALHMERLPLLALPVEPGVDIDAVHRRQAAAPALAPEPEPEPKPAAAPLVANSWTPRKPETRRKLTPQAEHVLKLADRPEGVTVAEVIVELDVQEPTAHRHCQRLSDELHLLTRVKVAGERSHRFFARPAAAAAYVESRTAGIRATVAGTAAKPAAQPPVAPAQRIDSTPAGLRRPGQPMTITPPRIDDRAMRPQGHAVETEATRRTVDTTARPTARWQAQQLPADPRWPSFSSAPLGVNPDTGRPWA